LRSRHDEAWKHISHRRRNPIEGVGSAFVRSADLIREARLRAGLTQYELAERSGRDRSVIARWEQGTVAPSVETLVELVRACGFDLPLELVPYDPSGAERLRKNALLSPERRVVRYLQAHRAGRRP
jgi:transcriptional regulator with XRE-family HTH domain